MGSAILLHLKIVAIFSISSEILLISALCVRLIAMRRQMLIDSDLLDEMLDTALDVLL